MAGASLGHQMLEVRPELGLGGQVVIETEPRRSSLALRAGTAGDAGGGVSRPVSLFRRVIPPDCLCLA